MSRPTFFYADYEYAPAFEGWHARINGDTHPLLTEQILLHRPLQAFSLCKLAAKAKSRQHVCVWWTEFAEGPLKDTRYSFQPVGGHTFLLLIVQPEVDFEQPFRLVICQVDDHFPKVSALWSLVAEYLADLSKQDAPQPV